MAKEKKSSGDQRLESFQSSLSRTEAFIEKNQKLLFYIVGGIGLIVLGIWGYNRFVLQPKIEKAENEIYMAQMYYEMDSLNLALNGDGMHLGFLDIVDEFGGTPSGNLSHYYIGMIYLKQGLFEDAIDELEQFDGEDAIIGPMATGCIGDAYVELGDLESALEYYIKAADQSVNDFTTPIYLMRAAWVHEDLGEWEEAVELYKRIKVEHWRSFEAREINKYIERAQYMINS